MSNDDFTADLTMLCFKAADIASIFTALAGVISYGNDWERSSHICFGCGNGVPTCGGTRGHFVRERVGSLHFPILNDERKVSKFVSVPTLASCFLRFLALCVG